MTEILLGFLIFMAMVLYSAIRESAKKAKEEGMLIGKIEHRICHLLREDYPMHPELEVEIKEIIETAIEEIDQKIGESHDLQRAQGTPRIQKWDIGSHQPEANL